MENTNVDSGASLILTDTCFSLLMSAVHKHFSMQHKGTQHYGVSQFYGFGNYNEDLPNLKDALQQNSALFINGKYLYDKKRELQSGKRYIKLTRPYKHLLFQYLGYEDVISFINHEIVDPEKRQEQLDLILTPNEEQTFYYISYHYGEYREIVKAQMIVRDKWKTVEYKYLYPQSDGTTKEFVYVGDIKKRADALHISLKTLMDGKMVQGGENILYIGYGEPNRSKYILGVFSAFDINNRLIVGKLIHKKCQSMEHMIELTKAKSTPAYIVQELRNQRFENENIIPNDKLELSNKSPYYTTYEKIAGKYKFSLREQGEEIGEIGLSIDPLTYKIKSMDRGILINKDLIELIQNGSILHFSFQLAGITSFIELEIYVKTYYLNESSQYSSGVYCGVDLENRLKSGEVIINYKAASAQR